MFVSTRARRLVGEGEIDRMAEVWYDESDDVVVCTGVGEAEFNECFEDLAPEHKVRVVSAFCRACAKIGVVLVGIGEDEC